MPLCSSCGQENPTGARFCNACSASLDEPASAAREERKVVTVLFADLVGFTARAEQMDPEDVRALLAPYHAHLRNELQRFGGTVEKFIGDAVMALFGAPVAHEDDPERAVRAALAIRDWVGEQKGLQLRIAITTGEALIALNARPEEGEGMAAGDVVNTAARLQSAAPVNGILVGETTYRATREAITYREAEPVEAKGKAEPIPVWKAVEARSRFGVDLGRAQAPLVGRERELDALRDALERARSQDQLQLVTLVGVPGIGKSRLVQELFKLIELEPDFTTWRQGRSLPYGEGVSFWALAEIVKAQAGILESDSDDTVAVKLRAAVEEVAVDEDELEWLESSLRGLVGLQSDGEKSETQSERFAAWRAFLEALADERPLVLVFEDLHWADDGLLEFVDGLVEWARSAPILVLCTARPELLERRPGWGGGKANAATLSLPPLEDDDTAKLFSVLLERAVLAAETQSALLARAAGNPLYAEQYARMLVEADGDAELALPETVQGIIAARLDGLADEEKTLLQNGAVVGKVFWLGSVLAIGGGEREGAEQALLSLERKELVQRARRSSVERESEYAFRHLLVRDVAYGQIPRAARADKHLAAAGWVEGLGRAEDHSEMLASHYSRALEYARASGQDGHDFVDPARQALRAAAERAESLRAWPAAARFYEGALELCPDDDPERADLVFRYGVAKFETDGSALELMAQGVDELEALGDLEAAADAAVRTGRNFWQRGDSTTCATYDARALALVGDRSDSPARVAALASRAAAANFGGRWAEALERIEEALPFTERLRLDELRVRLLQLRGYARVATGDVEGFADFEAAIALAKEVRSPTQLQSALNNRMACEISVGRLGGAREALQLMAENIERAPSHGLRRWLVAASATVDFLLGRWDDALERANTVLAEAEAGDSHVLDPMLHQLRSAILIARGDLVGAAADADALEESWKSEEAQTRAPALVWAAAVLVEVGRRDEAKRLLVEALEYGERLRSVLNDCPIVDAAWAAGDLGFEDEYRECLKSSLWVPWAAAAVAILDRDYRRAAEIQEQIGYVSGEAYARLRAARQLVDDGRRAEADVELQRSLAFWREVGATRYVREGEALLAASA